MTSYGTTNGMLRRTSHKTAQVYIINQHFRPVTLSRRGTFRPQQQICNIDLKLTIAAAAPWASYQIRKIAGCACAGNAGNVFPTTALTSREIAS